jgi:DNA-binding MarR family transcriptional regulator
MAEKQYSIMQSLMHDGAWFRFPKSFLKIMSRDEALVLAFLANHSFKVKCHDRKGWFFCKMTEITKELNMSNWTQTRVMSILEQNDLIVTMKRGMPAKRWIYIRWKEIERRLHEAEEFNTLHAPEENQDWSSPDDDFEPEESVEVDDEDGLYA